MKLTLDPPTKKEIIERLFNENHISFNEMWILLDNITEVRYVPMPPVYPYTVDKSFPQQDVIFSADGKVF